MQMTSQDIDAVCGLVLDLCGVYLDETKAYLIESRLGTLAKREGCSSYVALTQRARVTGDLKLKQDIVDAITTQETLFFRDNSPFEALRNKALPELFDAKEKTPFPRRIRIWSAACSTGQEPYSIAMTLIDLIPDIERWDIQILATDISDAAIAKASRGVYAEHEVARGATASHLDRYFVREQQNWRISDRVRSLVAFRRYNLHDSFHSLGQFDVVFCRNVAIYFTPEARQRLFFRIADAMAAHSYLFVGASESLMNYGERFQPQHHCRSVFYQPNSDRTMSVGVRK